MSETRWIYRNASRRPVELHLGTGLVVVPPRGSIEVAEGEPHCRALERRGVLTRHVATVPPGERPEGKSGVKARSARGRSGQKAPGEAAAEKSKTGKKRSSTTKKASRARKKAAPGKKTSTSRKASSAKKKPTPGKSEGGKNPRRSDPSSGRGDPSPDRASSETHDGDSE